MTLIVHSVTQRARAIKITRRATDALTPIVVALFEILAIQGDGGKGKVKDTGGNVRIKRHA